MARTAPYGTWASPVTLDELVADVVGLSFPASIGDDVVWCEARPDEGGRSVLVRLAPGAGTKPVDVFGPGFDARTAVHEYGGRCVTGHGDTVFFSNRADQRLYRVEAGADPVAITPSPPAPRATRFAAPVLTADRRHLVAVRERHGDPDLPATVRNDLVAVAVSGEGEPRVLAAGHDFYAHPAVSPDGTRLAWVSWDHPNMPWDGTELWEAELDGGVALGAARRVAGGPAESVTQPAYTPAGDLVFSSDRTGWWNLYLSPAAGGGIRALAPMAAEMGAPDWVFGTSSYAVLADGSIVATWWEEGLGRLGVLRPGAAAFVASPTKWTSFAQLRAAADGRSALAVAGAATEPKCVVRIVPGDDAACAVEVLKRSRAHVVAAGFCSVPEPISFPSAEGRDARALFYAPRNPGFEGPPATRPPLLVRAHGGPTSAASTVLDYGVQFWTSRGFAVVDVNYGGSTGFGRAYRERLRGRWGVVDLEDCVHAARHLVETGRVDGERMVVHGGSAGGYTALCAATFTGDFAAAASHYGVADAAALAAETHKFESHYTDGLIGPWPAAADVYRARSPAAHPGRLRTPLIVFHGLEDPIVPPAQAELVVAALRANGVPHAYVAYEGEQHGFRKAESIRRTAEAELYFYGRVLRFEPADDLVPVEIVHAERIGA